MACCLHGINLELQIKKYSKMGNEKNEQQCAIHDVSKRYMVLKYDDSLEKYVQYSRELGYYEAQKFYNDSVNILKHQVIMCQIHYVSNS